MNEQIPPINFREAAGAQTAEQRYNNGCQLVIFQLGILRASAEVGDGEPYVDERAVRQRNGTSHRVKVECASSYVADIHLGGGEGIGSTRYHFDAVEEVLTSQLLSAGGEPAGEPVTYEADATGADVLEALHTTLFLMWDASPAAPAG